MDEILSQFTGRMMVMVEIFHIIKNLKLFLLIHKKYFEVSENFKGCEVVVMNQEKQIKT